MQSYCEKMRISYLICKMWKQENRFKVVLTRDLVNIIYDIEMIKWQIKLHITHTYEYMIVLHSLCVYGN